VGASPPVLTAATLSVLNSVSISVSRTSIPLNTETKDRLSELKRNDETWDEFFDRLLSENSEGMAPGTLSDEEADKLMDVVREGA